ncbi:hypothetical protein FRACYDRAFT_255887 [Fragilariopsis cylindrus CCMP1102]|uniref:Uncharacterized protein n=1 Tax=Fragilariopsis cylindrus CCMP1102 TaxID=635003 RepID=A0A1E7EKV4_9STRA|nr:hypothetical protein FRACYDRAFT_255887 [Fragilariopsis cylindrus CCMP1102]|eukprot:OEU06183.1 hypothetical protein FRACYDRAFT_255887 [Fragilariopsis cylindrus CCMP1102]
MAKRKANTGICIPRRSPRLQELAEEERIARITARITEMEVMTLDGFNCLYNSKTIITVARPPEDDLPKDGALCHTYLYSIVERFIDLLSRSDLTVEKLTFENVPVDEEQLKKDSRWFSLSKAFSVNHFNANEYEKRWTYELPRSSVLETISFVPGLKKPTTNDLRAMYYLALKNKNLKSIKVLNSDNKQVKGTIILSERWHGEDFIKKTLNILSERALNTYSYYAKLERLDAVMDMERALYIRLKARLWSQTVTKLLSPPFFYSWNL